MAGARTADAHHRDRGGQPPDDNAKMVSPESMMRTDHKFDKSLGAMADSAVTPHIPTARDFQRLVLPQCRRTGFAHATRTSNPGRPMTLRDDIASHVRHLRRTKIVSPKRRAPICCSTATIPVDWWPWGPAGARRGQAEQQADPALDRLRRLPLVPCDGARELRGRADRGGDERPVRQHQGRSRGAARHRPDLHGRAASRSASKAAGR